MGRRRGGDTPKRDIFQEATDQIVLALEQGVGPWTRSWQRGGAGGTGALGMIPYNYVSGREYSGINVILAWVSSWRKRYCHPGWMTFNQAKEATGYRWDDAGKRWVWPDGEDPRYGVRKGEKATTITFWTQRRSRAKDPDEDEDGESRSYCIPIPHAVFNAEQVDGLDLALPAAAERTPEQTIAHAEAFVQATGAVIRTRGNQPCYIPAIDEIHMPDRTLFRTLCSGTTKLAPMTNGTCRVPERAKRKVGSSVTPLSLAMRRNANNTVGSYFSGCGQPRNVARVFQETPQRTANRAPTSGAPR